MVDLHLQVFRIKTRRCHRGTHRGAVWDLGRTTVTRPNQDMNQKELWKMLEFVGVQFCELEESREVVDLCYVIVMSWPTT